MQAVSQALEACQGIQDRDRQAAQSGDGSGRHAAEEVTRIARSTRRVDALRLRHLCYNSLMTLVATASFVALGEDKIEHTVVVSPDKAKNKAFRVGGVQ